MEELEENARLTPPQLACPPIAWAQAGGALVGRYLEEHKEVHLMRLNPTLLLTLHSRAQVDGAPGERDLEEFIEVHRMSLGELRRVMASGDMLLPSVATCFLALDRLRCLGHID